MQARRDLFFAHLNSLLGLNLPSPAAAFYAFLPISIFTSQPISDLEFCEKVMEEANVAIVPGSPFGRADHVRFSFGETEQELKEALDVLIDYCKRAL
jgi:aspartate aminotransferase